MRRMAALGIMAMLSGYDPANAQNISPDQWPKAERERLEELERHTVSPLEAQTVEGSRGLISATVSPIAVYAGIQTLKAGGSAADAAATVALTQVTTQLGSVVSYAGVFTMLYYDAGTHKVYSLDAGYNSYSNEKDPTSIPVSDLGPLNGSRKPTLGGAKGRETLVPGFMAGIEALHRRFGVLPIRELFAPAIWCAEHGVVISPVLQGYFQLRRTFLARTAEGQRFMSQSGREVPAAGDLFKQPELADTLRAVAKQGARYMYSGQWGRDFVTAVQHNGGKVTLTDLERYRPIWGEPYHETVFGHTVYVNGPPNYGAHNLFAGLNLAEARGLARRGSYWTDEETFRDLARINLVTAGAPFPNPLVADLLRARGFELTPAAMLTKDYATALAPILDQVLAPSVQNLPKHSNAIVVIDARGNIAAVTHTINSVIWGDTGIVVGGIPIPDSAGFQQARLAQIKPGERVPHEIIDTIAFEGEKPTLATASIGASLVPESVRVLLGILGQHQDLVTVMSAPALLIGLDMAATNAAPSQVRVPISQGAYEDGFLSRLRASGLVLNEVPAATSAGLRGTLAAISIDAATGKRTAVNQPGVMVFNGAEGP